MVSNVFISGGSRLAFVTYALDGGPPDGLFTVPPFVNH